MLKALVIIFGFLVSPLVAQLERRELRARHEKEMEDAMSHYDGEVRE